MKQLWMLVGGNGAGKSTFYHKYLEPKGLPFVNADILAKQLYPDNPELHSYEAARYAEMMREKLIMDGANFCFETVFSHPSKVDFLGKAKAFGYQIIMVVIHVDDVSLNQARVSQRVSTGGHHVPDDKVASRIPRTLDNVRSALPLCDHVTFLDNSSAENPYVRLATIKNQVVTLHQDPMPAWLAAILNDQ
jgi:predicted ABC-type ATPase